MKKIKFVAVVFLVGLPIWLLFNYAFVHIVGELMIQSGESEIERVKHAYHYSGATLWLTNFFTVIGVSLIIIQLSQTQKMIEQSELSLSVQKEQFETEMRVKEIELKDQKDQFETEMRVREMELKDQKVPEISFMIRDFLPKFEEHTLKAEKYILSNRPIDPLQFLNKEEFKEKIREYEDAACSKINSMHEMTMNLNKFLLEIEFKSYQELKDIEREMRLQSLLGGFDISGTPPNNSSIFVNA